MKNLSGIQLLGVRRLVGALASGGLAPRLVAKFTFDFMRDSNPKGCDKSQRAIAPTRQRTPGRRSAYGFFGVSICENLSGINSLECAALSALWPAAAWRRDSSLNSPLISCETLTQESCDKSQRAIAPTRRRTPGRRSGSRLLWSLNLRKSKWDQLLGVRRLVGALASGGLAPRLIAKFTFDFMRDSNPRKLRQVAAGQSADKAAHSRETLGLMASLESQAASSARRVCNRRHHLRSVCSHSTQTSG